MEARRALVHCRLRRSRLDAAALQVGLSGLLPADDERFAAPVEAVELRLREGPTVYRYRSDDGLPGSEGGFHLCALWLAHAYALVGRQSDAHALFHAAAELMRITVGVPAMKPHPLQ
jgi:GH15 family glucan-1,4-alpha-glucosidase